MADATFTPSASVTKFGSLLVILLVAIVAVWLINNVAWLQKFTARRATAPAA